MAKGEVGVPVVGGGWKVFLSCGKSSGCMQNRFRQPLLLPGPLIVTRSIPVRVTLQHEP